MEQYMSKTRADYGSGIARPKIEDKDSFELKGQFLKELRDNTFSGSDHEDANEHIEKVFEIVDLFHIPNITIDQITTWEYLKTKLLSKYCPPARTAKKWKEIKKLSARGAIPSKIVTDAKVAIQEMVEYSQKWHNGTSRTRSTETSNGLAAIQVQLNNLGREIKKVNKKIYVAQVGCEQYFVVLEDMDAYRDEGMSDDHAERKEIDNVGGESTIWKSGSVGVLKSQDGFWIVDYHLAQVNVKQSPDFDLFSDQEEYSEEEVAKTMEKIMEQYMSKTRADYGSGVARPKIEDKDNFELKGQFLKELRTNTFSGSDHEDANEHIKKVLEIVDVYNYRPSDA
ncbi:hypothetical protein Tco_0435606 [Tanacetum coccineum]